MTWLLTADLHLTDKQEDSYRFNIFQYVEKIILDNEVSDFFILGDLTDKTDGHRSSLVNNICENIFRISRIATVHILMGNHDCVDWSNPYFRFLDKLDNINYYFEPLHTKIYLRDIEKEVLILPCTKNPETDWSDFLSNRYFNNIDFIFTHMTFDGSISESGYRLEGISSKIFNDFKKAKVYSGDIHRPQNIGKVTYVGSPYYVRFGDNFNHRILLIDKNIEKEFRPNMKRKLTFEISEVNELDDLDIRPGDQVKLRYVLDREKALEWDNIVKESNEKIKRLGAENIIFEPVIEIDEKTESTKDMNKNEEDWISSYCRKKDINEYMKEIGEKIYRQVTGDRK